MYMIRNWNWTLLGSLWVLLLSSACQFDTPVAEEQLLAEERALQPQESNRYYHLQGSLGDLAISMELQEESNFQGREGRFFRGFYRYDDYGGPIGVYGNLENGNRLILTEQGSWDGEPHLFQGRWEESGEFSGLWQHSNGKDVYDFRLQKSQNAIPLKAYWIQDSLVVYPQWAASPILSYSLEWMDVAEGKMPREQRDFLREQMARGMLEGNAPGNPDDLLAKLTEERNSLYADFREEMSSMIEAGIIDSLAEPEAFLSFNYSYNTSVQVYYNAPNLLTLGFTDYSYTGGAHGMYATIVSSYDLKQNKVLKLSDVLLPGYVEAVSRALANAVRRKYNLGDAAPLNTFLFEEEIAPNENYGFTDKGVFFVYAPYEIAPYAAGEIELFVSFERIKEFVNPAWLSEKEEPEEE
jgi:hypothetical protein